jgi:hypothetical protein
MAKKNDCSRYGQAITNYVLGDKIDIPESELMEHLKTCAKCRAQYSQWADFTGVLKTEAYYDKPEVKKKWQDFIHNLVNKSAPCGATAKGEQDIDLKWEFGSPAGVVYDYLNKQPNKKAPVNDLFKYTDLGLVKGTIGMVWLTAEKKLCMKRSGNTTYVYLAPTGQAPQK